MSTLAIIANLQGRGLSLTVVGDQLHIHPKVLLTEGDRGAIRTHLREIITSLAASGPGKRSIGSTTGRPTGIAWDLSEAMRLMTEADDLVSQYAIDGRHPTVLEAAAVVGSAYASQDWETFQFALAEFRVAVRAAASGRE
jgi:hypothetical protein